MPSDIASQLYSPMASFYGAKAREGASIHDKVRRVGGAERSYAPDKIVYVYTCIQSNEGERKRMRLQSEPSCDAVRRVCRCEKYIDFLRGRVYNNDVMYFACRFID